MCLWRGVAGRGALALAQLRRRMAHVVRRRLRRPPVPTQPSLRRGSRATGLGGGRACLGTSRPADDGCRRRPRAQSRPRIFDRRRHGGRGRDRTRWNGAPAARRRGARDAARSGWASRPVPDTAPSRGATRLPSAPRRPDGATEPDASPRPDRARLRAGDPQRDVDRSPVSRHRQVQGRQRQPGPRRGRPAPGGLRRACRGDRARERHDRKHGGYRRSSRRRRVRRALRGPRQRAGCCAAGGADRGRGGRALRSRRQRAQGLREHRDRRLLRATLARRAAHSRRRPRDVPRQGGRTRPLRALRRSNANPSARTHRAREGPAQGTRTRRATASLPAAGLVVRRLDRRHGGTAALESSRPRRRGPS
jgi:hypothetical protein